MSLREDPRNEAYPIAPLLAASAEVPLASKTWASPYCLDQGQEGACVGFAGAHWFGTDERQQTVTTKIARALYHGAQLHDEWPGESYEGTSVNGLAAYLRSIAAIGAYRWISTIDELQRTIALHGPVIVGSAWTEGMSHPDHYGFIRYDGMNRGGHATCWRGVNFEERYFLIQQSWGRGHGLRGTVKLRFADAADLLRTGPQICFPEKRALQSLTQPRRWWQFWK